MKAILSALGCGLLFGVGLCFSGMADPKNVLAFLDITGHWSPNLAGVMLGAIAVHASWLRFVAPRWSGGRSAGPGASLLPARGRIDAALIGGAALFGVGWGLSGYCPGPSIVALGSGALGALLFVGAMAVGIVLASLLRRSLSAEAPVSPSAGSTAGQ